MLSRDVWFTGTNVICPIPDRDPHVIEPKNTHNTLSPQLNANDAVHCDALMQASTHPAAAIALKSLSVIQVFQCWVNFACATLGSWYCPNVHSSTIAGLPVSSNKLGVTHGCIKAVQRISTCSTCKEVFITDLENEPPSKVDTAHWLRTIGKARGERHLCIPSWDRPSNRECGKKGSKGQCGEHDGGGKSLSWERRGKKEEVRRLNRGRHHRPLCYKTGQRDVTFIQLQMMKR